MDCAEARRVLWPPERLRVVADDVSRAQRHVQACECCRDYFEQDRALLDLYHRVRGIRAPRSVRQRVFDTLATARWGATSQSRGSPSPQHRVPLRDRPRRHAVLPVVLAVIAAVILGIGLYRPSPDDEPSAVFVEDYLRRAVGQERIESDDPREIRRFLERELGLSVRPLRAAGFSPVRAEICLLEGRRGAMIVYHGVDGNVSHYVVPKPGVAERQPAVSTRAGGPVMPVVTWAGDDVEQALVGDMEADVLLDLAEGSLR